MSSELAEVIPEILMINLKSFDWGQVQEGNATSLLKGVKITVAEHPG